MFTLSVIGICASAISPYGHAFNAPGDFSPAQFATIASTFPLFTVEKRHAYAIYGNKSATGPAHYNSIAASVGTARKIKALNSSVRVLMYWNSALSYGFYECEEAIQKSWLLPPAGNDKPPRYNYAVPSFRAWWVACAVGALKNSSGALDGLFLDAVPKLLDSGQPPNILALWGAMVDAVRVACPEAFVIYNGASIDGSNSGPYKANASLLAYADALYVESLALLCDAANSISPSDAITFLSYLASAAATAQNERKFVMGHGLLPSSGGPAAEATFLYGLALFLLISPEPETGYFISNDGYNIDQGLLTMHPEYDWKYGTPLGAFTVYNDTTLTRNFSNATVVADLVRLTATITLGVSR